MCKEVPSNYEVKVILILHQSIYCCPVDAGYKKLLIYSQFTHNQQAAQYN